jgi:hypothetical protein
VSGGDAAPATIGRGVAAWSSPAWREAAVRWIDERLAAAGRRRTGEVEQPHVRPWSTVLRVATTGGVVWMKAGGPGTAFEAGLYEVLARVVPDAVLAPLGTDGQRGWVLLPDGGPVLGERIAEPEFPDRLTAALVRYGRLQRALEPHVGELLRLGVPDMRPTAMPARFAEALDTVRELSERRDDAAGLDTHARVAALRSQVLAWCEELAASPLPAGLDHNDLHPWNILAACGRADADTPGFYDWGDSVVAHPFAAMLVPLGVLRHRLAAGVGDPRFTRARDAYLGVFAELAPRADLVATLEVACRVAKIARVLTWERALRATEESGGTLKDSWAAAPAETLRSLLDDGYLL